MPEKLHQEYPHAAHDKVGNTSSSRIRYEGKCLYICKLSFLMWKDLISVYHIGQSLLTPLYLLFFSRGFWELWHACVPTSFLSRSVQKLFSKIPRTCATSWLPTCWREVLEHLLFCTSSPHGTRTQDGQGHPLLQQPGQNHLNTPGTCQKKVVHRVP